MRVRITPLAASDLDGISTWIANDSPQRALSFVQELVDSCRSLRENADAHPVIRRYRGHDIRRRIHKKYLILYRVKADVEVIRILHGARDIRAALDEIQ